MDTDVRRIEIDIDKARDMIETADALRRLQNNKDFNKVINVGLFEEEAHRLVLLKSDPSMQTPEMQKEMDDAITMIGQLHLHFRQTLQLANQAKAEIEQAEEAREEILAEQIDNV